MPTLTPSLIKRSRPRAKKYEVADSHVHGLALRVLPSGKKKYVLRVRRGGKTIRQTLGSIEDMTLGRARELAVRSARTEAPTVTHAPEPVPAPVAVAAAPETSPTFSKFADMYIKRHVNKSLAESTAKNYRRALKLLRAEFGAMKLTEIRYRHVERFHFDHSDRPSAANSFARVLNHMYRKAAQWDLYPPTHRFPTSGLEYFREDGRERFLDPSERVRLESVLEAAGRIAPMRKGYVRWSHIAVIRLLSLTGCRRAEVLALRWNWIDRVGRVIRFPKTKTGKSIRPISQAVVDYLDELEREYRKPGVPYVVYGQNDQEIGTTSISDAWIRIRKRAKIEDVRLHDLRHSAASDALNAGVALEVVQSILGHKSIKTTQRYAHLARQVALDGTDRMTDRIQNPQRAKRHRR